MKIIRFSSLNLLFILLSVSASAVQLNKDVRNTTHPLITIPDSLDLSNTLFIALTRQEKIAQFNRLIGVYLNFAIDSLKAGKIEVAEKIMMEDALPMLSRYGDGYNMYHSFMTLGKSYTQQKKYTQAKWFFIQANAIAHKIGYNPGELFSLIELAKVKETIMDTHLALEDYKLAAVLATRIKFTNTLTTISLNIKRLSALEGALSDVTTVKSTPVVLKN